ncbi:hypothetical protein DACRYDRAFT_18829 [Dacryopinax primogenitus]|uniref:Uncharacterized protein n=1 Tax=Dacryopinax primogenitus (strain DJM 731) TaxID=1858805 RepID=M5FUV3_DACPD|nr:uncharacterized protein DACRYDRAFT_18829 [Dacryopinax primogenitus]EJT97056.1 hypothetical protein DACRYDRAFT_18829 [Dacryopinax primogenitus]
MRLKTIYAAIYLLASASINSALPVPALSTSYNPLEMGVEPEKNTQFSDNGLFPPAPPADQPEPSSPGKQHTPSSPHSSASSQDDKSPLPPPPNTLKRSKTLVHPYKPAVTPSTGVATLKRSKTLEYPYQPADTPSTPAVTSSKLAASGSKEDFSHIGQWSVTDVWSKEKEG